MSKTEESYEDQILKEFESSQNAEGTETVKSENLGKVKFEKGIDITADPEIQRIQSTMGYIDIPLDTLPSGGRFYPENTRISIRAARVGEIREFSTIDEENEQDIRDKMTYIVSQCTKVFFGNTPGYYKDIVDADRIILIFKIRELTFLEGQNSINIEVPDGVCSTPGCHPQKTVKFSTSKLTFETVDPMLEKYYDPAEKCFNVQTKRFGDIKLYPPTVGVVGVLSDWIEKQHMEKKDVNAPLLDLLQYLIKDWRGLGEKQIFAKITDLAGWPVEKFSLVYRLKEMLNIGINPDLTDTCDSCGGEIKIPITFPDGFRSLFIPTISALGDELL